MNEAQTLTRTEGQLCAESRRRIREELNAIRIGLAVLKSEFEEGMHQEAALTYQTIVASIHRLANDQAIRDG